MFDVYQLHLDMLNASYTCKIEKVRMSIFNFYQYSVHMFIFNF